jgi:hypothetical protein
MFCCKGIPPFDFELADKNWMPVLEVIIIEP